MLGSRSTLYLVMVQPYHGGLTVGLDASLAAPIGAGIAVIIFVPDDPIFTNEVHCLAFLSLAYV